MSDVYSLVSPKNILVMLSLYVLSELRLFNEIIIPLNGSMHNFYEGKMLSYVFKVFQIF